MSYNSKYSGQQVENLLDQVANGNVGGGGGITQETDPIFSASPAAGITDEDISSWNDKVDKVAGKQLSTEDFTTLLKQKLDGLSNYDDTEIQSAVRKLRTDLDTLVSGDTTTAIKTFNEVIAFLEGLKDTEDLASIIASIEQQIAAKQDKLVSGTNIKTINGQSILGEGDLTIEGGNVDIPTKVSDLENDSGFVGKSALGYIFDDNIETSGIVSADQGVQSPLIGADSTSQLYVESDGSISTYNSNGDVVLEIIGNGDGTKFLANDGTYKDIETSGGSSNDLEYIELNTEEESFSLLGNKVYHLECGEGKDYSFDLSDLDYGKPTTLILQCSNVGSITFAPAGLIWAENKELVIENGKVVEISIMSVSTGIDALFLGSWTSYNFDLTGN